MFFSPFYLSFSFTEDEREFFILFLLSENGFLVTFNLSDLRQDVLLLLATKTETDMAVEVPTSDWEQGGSLFSALANQYSSPCSASSTGCVIFFFMTGTTLRLTNAFLTWILNNFQNFGGIVWEEMVWRRKTGCSN